MAIICIQVAHEMAENVKEHINGTLGLGSPWLSFAEEPWELEPELHSFISPWKLTVLDTSFRLPPTRLHLVLLVIQQLLVSAQSRPLPQAHQAGRPPPAPYGLFIPSFQRFFLLFLAPEAAEAAKSRTFLESFGAFTHLVFERPK